MLLSLITQRMILALGFLFLTVSIVSANVCDEHLSRIKLIPFEGNAGTDAHYDALKTAGQSAVPCLIANITNTQPQPDPRPIPGWAGIKSTVGDRAVYMMAEITGVDTFKMLPHEYQDRHKQIGVYARDEYLHARRANRRILQQKLWRWYRTTYLPSLRKRAT